MRIVLIGIVLSFVLLSCSGVSDENEVKTYIDIKGLMKQQLLLLDSLNKSIIKTADINGSTETSVINPDSAGWGKELQIFMEADINKPVLKDQYTVEQGLNDSLSNLLITRILSKDPADTKVDRIDLYYVGTGDDLRKLTINISEKSALFNSEKILQMEFSEMSDGIVLSNYSVRGMQKISMQDSIKYEYKAEVVDR